jgi:3-hydroxybutyryl-CoA dehydratase
MEAPVTELPPSSLAVTADLIRSYADLTQDFNPLHLDAEFAATTPMKSVIAHGTMSIHLIWRSVAAAFGGEALSRIELDIRFVKPVRVGDTLHAGGRQHPDEDGTYEVWVRGDDGQDRISGKLRLLA